MSLHCPDSMDGEIFLRRSLAWNGHARSIQACVRGEANSSVPDLFGWAITLAMHIGSHSSWEISAQTNRSHHLD